MEQRIFLQGLDSLATSIFFLLIFSVSFIFVQTGLDAQPSMQAVLSENCIHPHIDASGILQYLKPGFEIAWFISLFDQIR